MRLLVFGAAWCPICQQLRKSRVVDHFARRHPEVDIDERTLEDGSGKVVDKTGDRLADRLGVKALPALIFLDRHNKEAARKIGMVSLAMLERLYERARSGE